MKVATIFSGIGAPEFAVKNIYGAGGFKTVFACEIDKFARQSYLANHEIDEANFYQDINDLDAKPYLGKVDILIGGSPCQDFSIAGLRQGISGKRGSLIWQYYRIISECMPKVFIYENVKGMLSDRGGRTLKEFLEVFRNLGYSCHAEVVNTKNYGIPQNRERIYITGFLDNKAYYAFAYAPKQPLRLNLGDMLETNTDHKYVLSEKTIQGFKKKDNGFQGSFTVKNRKDTANCIMSTAGSRRTDNFVCANEIKIKVVGVLDIKGNDSNKRVYADSGLSPTLTTSQGGQRTPKILEKTQDFCIRKLTPRECFRLQGFPDSFKIVVSDTQAYKQAGNAMSVNVVEMIVRQVSSAVKGLV
ncbi:DNA cytosine methyltransferase [Campylobacter sp. RM16192]|uniref:DNA cytosine methyltransferase n=1 Tax=Campylobacter sp. RM16192 TaxID=1660080 RepID=UPI0014516F97|nr:DNA cytosine methyltransferase [Campylobacter sp. RM16192]QCD52821.1 cytosine-specific DNA methyltransferase [Campylobacter sp. RM16192]